MHRPSGAVSLTRNPPTSALATPQATPANHQKRASIRILTHWMRNAWPQKGAVSPARTDLRQVFLKDLLYQSGTADFGPLIDCLLVKIHRLPRNVWVGVRCIIFLPFHKRLHILGRNQLHFMTKPDNLARPVMRAVARLHHHHHRRLLGHEPDETLPRQLLAELWLPRHRGRVQLKNILCQIHSNPCLMHAGATVLSSPWLYAASLRAYRT